MRTFAFYLYMMIGGILYAAETKAPTEEADTLSHNLQEVVVVAQESRGLSAGSRIDRSAMQHLQPTSFTDLLELLPGNISQDPKTGAANSITLRETGTITATGAKSYDDKYSITSLGTRFVIDGAAVGTDADLQTIAGIDPSDPAAARSSVNRGVDMRTLSTDNIESVEIVRGIPSAEYGNLTSGLVNIKRIKRSTPFTFRFKADEYSKLFSAAKGFAVGNTRHTINATLSYLDSKSDPRNSLENYKRVTATLLPTFRFSNETTDVIWSTGIDYTGSFDNAKTDPDLNFNKIDEFRSSYNRYAVSSDLNIAVNSVEWLDNIVANASLSYEKERTERRKQVAPSRAAVAPSGYDEGDHNVPLLLGEYLADYAVDGRPFTAAIKMKADGRFFIGKTTNRYKVGAEWSYAKNFGDGQVYDLSRPLSASWSTRPRRFSDIPAMQILSWFAEDNLYISLGDNNIVAQIGLRGMSMPALDSRYYLAGRVYLDPRVNLQWNLPAIDAGKPLRLSFTAGWGMNTRMPTLDYLHPQCHYNDIIQLNYYDAADPVANSLVNVRTYKVDVTNYNLHAATNRKWEARLGVNWGNNSLSVTYFDERMDNGFRYTPVYNPYIYRSYDISAYDPASHSVDHLPYSESSILDGFSTVTNGSRIHKRGIEYTLQTQRFIPLGTSLIINGAWFETTYSNSQALYSPVSDVVGNQSVSDLYVGIYNTTDGRINRQFNTNFLFDTQIPRWGLIFTTGIQCMWYVKTTRLRENGIPTSYIYAGDGKIHPFDAATDNPYLRYLVKSYNEDSFRTMSIPTAIYVNLKVSKQIGRWLRLSAFSNRIIDYLPDYKSNGLTIRRSSDAYFGMEATIIL